MGWLKGEGAQVGEERELGQKVEMGLKVYCTVCIVNKINFKFNWWNKFLTKFKKQNKNNLLYFLTDKIKNGQTIKYYTVCIGSKNLTNMILK